MMFRTTRLPFIIQKRARNSVKVWSTPEPCPILSWVTAWSFGRRIGCFVLWDRSSARRKRPSTRSKPSSSFLGLNLDSAPSSSPLGKASCQALFSQKVSAFDISAAISVQAFLLDPCRSLQLSPKRRTHPVTRTRCLRLENSLGLILGLA